MQAEVDQTVETSIGDFLFGHVTQQRQTDCAPIISLF